MAFTPLNQIQFGAGTRLAAPTTSTTGGPVQGGSTSFINNYNTLNPQMNYTTDAFKNAIGSGDNASAYQMLMQGGGNFQEAARQAMGWDNTAFSQFVNNADQNKASYAGVNPQTMQGYGATLATPTDGNIRNGPMGDTYTGSQIQNWGAGGGGFSPLAQGGVVPPPTIGSLSGAGPQPGVAPGASTAHGPMVNPAGYNPAGQYGSMDLPNTQGATNPAPIPGTQPNYPLDIGSYLNPMMQYALQNGISTINNSAAAAGNLNSGNTMKELMQFGTGVASNNFNNAANIAAGQQQFGYGVDNNDRNFNYMAQNNDRQFNLNALLGMGGLGLQGTTQQGVNDRLLATLLSNNAATAGQLQGAGTIGSGNAVTTAIQQWLASAMNPAGGK